MIANVFRHVPIDRGPATEIKPKEAWTPPWRLHPGRKINRKLDKTLHTLILFTILIITIPNTIIIIPTIPITIMLTILIITTTTISSAMVRFLVYWVRSRLLEESTSSRACAAASRRLETPGSLRWGLFFFKFRRQWWRPWSWGCCCWRGWYW